MNKKLLKAYIKVDFFLLSCVYNSTRLHNIQKYVAG